MMRRLAIAALFLFPVACGGDDDDGNADDSSEAGPDSNTNGSTNGNTNSTTNTNGTTNGNTSGEPATDCDLDASFDGNGGAWPSPWEVSGGVATADVVDGRARLVPTTSNYSLARMYADADCTDAEVTFSFAFSDGASQGIGVYVRSNGGHLQTTTPHGTGYAVFIEAFRQPVGLGAWVEIDGVEMPLEPIESFAISANVAYNARLRVTQADAGTTSIQARMWRDGDAEPDSWQVERTDQTGHLQGAGGGLAIDSWSSRTSGAAADLFIDDIQMRAAE